MGLTKSTFAVCKVYDSNCFPGVYDYVNLRVSTSTRCVCVCVADLGGFSVAMTISRLSSTGRKYKVYNVGYTSTQGIFEYEYI